MGKITSRQNPRVKYLASLQSRKERKKTQETILEGPNLIKEANRAGIDFIEILATEDFLATEGFYFKEKITLVSEEVMDKISPTRTPRGIIARIKQPYYPWQELLGGEKLLLLEGLQDPGNVGTLIRTAAGADLDGIILLGEGADPYQPKVLRASAGAIFWIPVGKVKQEERDSFFSELPRDFSLYVAQPGQGRDFRQVKFAPKSVLVLGHETRGISGDFSGRSVKKVSIPLAREIESLNVAAAGAILIWAMQS